MRRLGLVTDQIQSSPNGPARKVYSLTDAGHARLRTWRRQWTHFVDTVNATLPDPVPDSPRS
jgi:PadR family transcriptional regulator PadR